MLQSLNIIILGIQTVSLKEMEDDMSELRHELMELRCYGMRDSHHFEEQDTLDEINKRYECYSSVANANAKVVYGFSPSALEAWRNRKFTTSMRIHDFVDERIAPHGKNTLRRFQSFKDNTGKKFHAAKSAWKNS